MSTQKQNDFLKELLRRCIREWPPVIARQDISQYTGGLLSPENLANIDSRGEGPPRVRLQGRKVGYPSRELADWLKKRLDYLPAGTPGDDIVVGAKKECE